MRRSSPITRVGFWTIGLLAGVCAAPAALAGEFQPSKVPPGPNGKTPPPPKYPISPGLVEPPPKPKPLPEVPPFAGSPLGARPHLGGPDDGGIGYRHYDFPDYRYDIWYRPDRFGWGVAERCAPSPFRPRGYGNLFNRPSTCYRIDYNRYVLKNHRSGYGPSYYRRGIDQRCPDYDHSEKHRPDCDPCRLRRTSVWTLRSVHE